MSSDRAPAGTPFTTGSDELNRYINLKLAALGQPPNSSAADPYFLEIAGPLLRNFHQKDQLLGDHLCPADSRIQQFLDCYLAEAGSQQTAHLPAHTFTLDRTGLARALSLPVRGDAFASPYLNSYRVAQGVLHNPRSDRRTTLGVFHIAEGGLPIPADKRAVPRRVFARLLAHALQPPADALKLPFTSDQDRQARLFVSLLIRPLVCPATGADPARTMEIRFFAPGSLVSNLDFIEMIFGNGGDPYLPENDAALDARHWTGHTGCVIIAPHLTALRKKDLGLPGYDAATERQRRDGMCWRSDDELYNDGSAFKIVCRDRRGVIVTILADNYLGYCKKEVKSQISYAANLYGLCEEEHSGGAIAYPAYILGQQFQPERHASVSKAAYGDAMRLLEGLVDLKPEGYAVDRRFPDIFYVPEDAEFSVAKGCVTWRQGDGSQSVTLLPERVYVLPSGYKVRLEKQTGGSAWRLVGSVAHGTLCHKPSTVSGGGKSEISKHISSVMLRGPVFIRNYFEDLRAVDELLTRDYSGIYKTPQPPERAGRPVLSTERSLGSVIKLLTASPEYKDEYNAWLRALPQTIRQLVFTLKRYYRPEWGDNWREHFTVDRINGFLGHELKFRNRKLVANYVRVGFDPAGSWRIYKLRPDFFPADKVQVADDITASVVVPLRTLNYLGPKYGDYSVKLIENCETYLFQRPDDATHRGFDAQAEADIAGPGVFLSNFEPLTRGQAAALRDHVVDFDQYTQPMQNLIRRFTDSASPEYVVSSAHPRLVDGRPSKNPRYLELRPDLVQPRQAWLSEVGARLDRGVPASEPVRFPVNAVIAGRRANPPDPKAGLPPLAVYSPIHYQELPELFMDFICSLTGKSPSTTGFGSEGALTKGPFNALWPVVDLNNALVAAILTGQAGFTTAAGYVGPNYEVQHDISLLAPEVWCRMQVEERDPKFLIENGYLEKLKDFEYHGRRILASRLGYRITALFADRFLGRLFETPDAVFTGDILRPELQDPDAFAAGVEAIVDAQRRVALSYFEDGSVEGACPPIRALLSVMACGEHEGLSVEDPRLRGLFTRDALLSSDWYAERLRTKQCRDVELWERRVAALERANSPAAETATELAFARERLENARASSYLSELEETLGADPLTGQ